MIDKQEVMEFAREFGLAPQVIEKDYALGWLLAGIAADSIIGKNWVFKGGTCLKKCFFETYRFSEDLDFTLTKPEHLSEEFLIETFRRISMWIYDQSGMEIPEESFQFDIYKNPRGNLSCQGRAAYNGPMQRRGSMPRIKLDLTADEVLVLSPEIREVHHPYSDLPQNGIRICSYRLEEVFAEKIRALAERERPRDLYDVIHLYRREELNPDRALILSTLSEKCLFKGINIPTMKILSNQPARIDLEADWEQMLAHQLPALPPFDEFWSELADVFDWLHQVTEKAIRESAPVYTVDAIDESWSPPIMAQAWHAQVPLSLTHIFFSSTWF